MRGVFASIYRPRESRDVLPCVPREATPDEAPEVTGYVRVRRAGAHGNGEALWLCRCGCGHERVIRSSKMRPGLKCRRCTQAERKEAASSLKRGGLVGRWFGSKQVLRELPNGRWLARCRCGAERAYTPLTVKATSSQTCAQCRPPLRNLHRRGVAEADRTGLRFGRLTVLRRDLSRDSGVWWVCLCDCGRFVSKKTAKLGTGKVCGLGCPYWKFGKGESHPAYKHGMSGTREYQSAYRGKRGGKRAGSLPRGYLDVLWTLQKGKCATCRVAIPKAKERTGKVHLDHIVPIAARGEHDKHNVQLLCSDCNVRKSSKDPIVWMQERGFLI